MSCMIRKRNKLYKKYKLDLWGIYTVYNNISSKSKKYPRAVWYWFKLKVLSRNFRWFKRRRYIYSLWNRERFIFPKRLKANYIKPRLLRSFYMVLKKRNYVKYVKLALKGKVVRGFIKTFLNYLEGRLFVILYRLNLITNIFIIKGMVNLGMFCINFEQKKHINTRMQLGDMLHIKKFWKSIIRSDMLGRLNQGIITRFVKNFYINYSQMYFILYKSYNPTDIKYPIRIDLYRAMDFIGPLR